ncbi:MAG: hypothetical protein LLG00_16295 [Planctomycetaceae bacterium]|nr:hypothetical protein [Planctomycetaceae bacterium]
MNGQCNVLIVDRSEETREVLQTVLERRGVRTLTTGKPETGAELAQRHHPELIVLDLESLDGSDASLRRAGILPATSPAGNETGKMPDLQDDRADTSMSAASSQSEYQPQLVLLGSLRGWRDQAPAGEFVAKPYHYGPLIRRIEELLGGKARPGTSVPLGLGQGTCRRYSSSAAPIKEAAST